MQLKTLILAATLVLGHAFAGANSASSEGTTPVFAKKVAPAEFLKTLQTVRDELKHGGRWEYVPNADRPTLEAAMKTMESLLAGRTSIDGMSDEDKTKLFNAQEQVNAILAQNDSQRLVCELVKPTGSHIPKRVCMTYAEKKLMLEDSASALQRMQKGPGLPQRQ